MKRFIILILLMLTVGCTKNDPAKTIEWDKFKSPKNSIVLTVKTMYLSGKMHYKIKLSPFSGYVKDKFAERIDLPAVWNTKEKDYEKRLKYFSDIGGYYAKNISFVFFNKDNFKLFEIDLNVNNVTELFENGKKSGWELNDSIDCPLNTYLEFKKCELFAHNWFWNGIWNKDDI